MKFEFSSDEPSKTEHFLRSIDRKLDLITSNLGVVMADVAPLTAVLDELDTDEVAAVSEFKALAEEIAQLTTERAPSQAQLDELTAKATAIAQALKAGTPSKAPATEPAPAPAPAPTGTGPAQQGSAGGSAAPASAPAQQGSAASTETPAPASSGL